MKQPDDLPNLVDEDISTEELDRLRHVDALLRSTPQPPPEIPVSLTRAVLDETVARLPRRRRAVLAVALAAALAALSFGLGAWFSGDDFDVRRTAPLEATENAPGAGGELRLGERMSSGNWGVEVDVEGLRPLPKGGYYVLWLAKDGEYAATCGTFTVGRDGSADVYMNASYNLREYDAWVITASLPDRPADAPNPWLLKAEI